MGEWRMFQYAVNAALGSQADEVWVSTDSDEVEKITLKMKNFAGERLYVHRRTTDEELEPETGVVKIAQEVILQEDLIVEEDPENNYIMILLANCPEIKADEIDEAFRMLEWEECQEVRSFKSYRLMNLKENGLWGMKTSRLFSNPYGTLSAYVGGLLTNATEIETQEDFDWVLNVMTKRGMLHAN